MNYKTMMLSDRELVFLAALLGEAVVLGVDDPFLGWLAEQVEEEWKMLSPQMHKKGFIYVGENGNYEVSPEIAKFIRLCCSPDIWVSAAVSANDKDNSSFVLNLGTADKITVKVGRKQENGSVELSYGFYERKESLQICNALGIVDGFENKGARLVLPETVFRTLTEGTLEDGLTCLKDFIEDDKIEPEHFIRDIKTPDVKALINIGSMKSDSSAMASFVLIERNDRLWIVQYHDDGRSPRVSVRQSGPTDLSGMLDDFLKQFE